MFMRKLINLLVLLLSMFTLFSQLSAAENEIIVPVSSDAEITIEHFSSEGKYLMLWLAPEYGLRENHRAMARKLGDQNIEVWLTNIVESLFLTQSLSSLKQLDGKMIADVIEYAHKKTGKKIIVAGDSYASISALTGAHQWQQRNQNKDYLIGAVLFSPYVYATIPPLGLAAEFMPIISATNIPIMIYQATKSGNITLFNQLLETLQQHDNPVYSKFILNIRSLFYSHNPTPEVKNNLNRLAPNIRKMISVLERHKLPTAPVPLKNIKIEKSGIDNFLKEYKGTNRPFTIKLNDVYGNSVTKNDYKGQITVVNFWATWCPPCVEEIPSLNRLKKTMAGLPFELISINYAEDNQTILDFMKKVKVEFPVLLDHNGNFAKQWNVITYPSTFIIDPLGNIRYGVNAAIEWDNPEFIDKIKLLLKNN
jgi:thiol-disulfide isomerase/thioredoxin